MTSVIHARTNMPSEEWKGKQPYPRAYSVQVWTCGDPECGRPHLMLLDAKGNTIAEAVMPDRACELLYHFDIVTENLPEGKRERLA